MEKPQLYFKILSTLVFFIAIMSCNYGTTMATKLFTKGRWIVDKNGERVKLACVNWPSHMEALMPEGLNKQPADTIAKKIKSMGFNCVRLTWAEYLVSNQSLSSLTVRQSFTNIGLKNVTVGIQKNNPSLIDLPLLKAYKAVLDVLGKNKLMVVVDNHVSKPGWCCDNNDGNGFFGDKYFDPKRWVHSVSKMAKAVKGYVIGMSLRNELRGPRQNSTVWYKYMQRGAEAIHAANPDALVIFSGFNYDTDLSFLRDQPVSLSFEKKLVFEVHRYSWSDKKHRWDSENANDLCGHFVKEFMSAAGYLLKQGYPLFVSEFGINQKAMKANDTRFLNCIMGVLAEHDLDWAIWSLQGSYYFREGQADLEETFGMLTKDWKHTRNPSFLHQISTLQSPFLGGDDSSMNTSHQVIFHPSTGLCVQAGKSKKEPLKLGSCNEASAWTYTHQNRFILMNTSLCLQGGKLGHPVKLAYHCSRYNTRWETISGSKMHFSIKHGRHSRCLGINNSKILVTHHCKCMKGESKCDPTPQWFKAVSSTGPSKADNNLN